MDGEDVRQLPCIERRDRLRELIGPDDGVVRFSDHVIGQGSEFYARACELALEEIVSKRADALYRSGRSDAWVKTKCYEETAYRVSGIQRERGKPSYAVMGSLEDGSYVGSAFIALPRAQRDLLYQLAEAGGGSKPLGYEVKKSFPAEWIRKVIVGRVLHLRGEDTLRHARLTEIVTKE